MLHRPLPRHLLLALAITLAATAVASFADQWFYAHAAYAGVYDTLWGKALRMIGEKYLFLWLGVGVLVLAYEAGVKRAPKSLAGLKAAAVVAGPVFAAGATFILKHLAHRRRPPLEAGGQVTHLFDALFGAARHAAQDPALKPEVFHSFPSGHTTIAFAGAFVLAWLYPRGAAVWLALAAGCAFTRLLAHAHHLSDVVFAAGVGFAGAWCAAWLAGVLAGRMGLALREKSGRRGE